MARIEYIHERLVNWALWHERRGGGALGFPSQSSFLREAASTGTRESHVPCDEVEASITEEAVQAFRVEQTTHHQTLLLFYLEGMGTSKTARKLGITPSTVSTHMTCADLFIRDWLDARQAKRSKPGRSLQQLRADKRAQAEREERERVEAEERERIAKAEKVAATKAKRAAAARARRARNQKKSFTT